MPLETDYPIQKSQSRLRIQFLVQLRWLAIAGQILSIYLVAWVLGWNFNWAICLGIVTISIWLNIVLRMYYPARTRPNLKFATSLLLYDIFSIAALLYMTGGIQNPFVFLMIAPTVISASTLPLKQTFFIGGITLVTLTFISIYHQPVPWFSGVEFDVPDPYKIAIAMSFLAALVYVAAAAYLLSTEARRMSAALAATEAVLAREQQLNALDGLAAAAAHELGTPLGTIYVTSKELMRSVPEGGELSDDLKLISSQAERCRTILTKLTRSPEETDALLKTLTLTDLIKEVADPFQFSDIRLEIVSQPTNKAKAVQAIEPLSNRNPGVLYGLGNLIENAIDYAEEIVAITANWTDDDVFIVIADDGPGFPPEILDTLGEPFITTRSATTTSMEMSDGSGLGLGFFIAKTLLERSGATLTLANRLPPEHGAVIRIHWPRAGFEAKQLSIVESSSASSQQQFVEEPTEPTEATEATEATESNGFNQKA